MDREQADRSGLEPVRIGEGEVAWLKETWSKQWLRQPNGQELKGLVDALVTEDLLAREAKAMGLDEDDTIIRRRLGQKLRFLVEDTARLAEPTDGDLREFYLANLTSFQTGATVSFRQIYFNAEHRRDAVSDAKVALAELRAGGGHEIAATVGDRSLLDAEFRDVDEQAVTAIFGPEFSQEVFALAAGAWNGPVKSGYGNHLVLVDSSTPARQRPFEEVRDKVLEEWRAEQQRTANRDYIDRLRGKYRRRFRRKREVAARHRTGIGIGSAMRPASNTALPARRLGAYEGAVERVLFALAVVAASLITASAHEVRPAYLDIREDAPGEFSVLLKTPMQGDARLALSAAFSGKVEALTPVVSRPTGNAMLQTWQIRAVEPLEGQAVSIDGLQSTMTDALVRVEFLDGYVWLEKLTPGAPGATIPGSQSSWAVAKTYVVSGIEHILFRLRPPAFRFLPDADRPQLASAGKDHYRVHRCSFDHAYLCHARLGDTTSRRPSR